MEKAYSTLTHISRKSAKINNRNYGYWRPTPRRRIFGRGAASPIKWRGTSRRPIPDAWKEIGQRTSLFHLAGNRNASHPVNAILNYAYTVLQSQLQINAIADGYDPTIGIMHEGNNGSAAFIFDLMEPFRPLVDRNVLEFIKGHVFDPSDFVIRSDGVCRLNPEMARCVVGLVACDGDWCATRKSLSRIHGDRTAKRI